MFPLICTSNTQSHVDYGIPIVANKSTDYRTSTGTYHRFIPSVSGDNDCVSTSNICVEQKLLSQQLFNNLSLKVGETLKPYFRGSKRKLNPN